MINHHSISDGLFGFGSFAVTKGLEAGGGETPSAASPQNRHALLTAQILEGLREISKKVPKSITAQLRSVSEASDERSFCQGLLAVGQALVSDGKLEQAALVYNSLQGIIPEHLGELKAEANNRLAALSNRGDLAYQAPVILQQLKAGLTDEVGLGGMVAAQVTFGLSRVGIFRLLENVWKASRVERLAVASGAAFGLEGAALVGAGEGLGYALGHEAVEGDLTLRQKFGHAYLMMGSLRGAFSLVGAMVGRHTLAAASPLARMGQIVAPQVGMFGAIAFTHAVAPSLDLGITPENLGLASLVTYLHFTAAGLALHAIPGYGALNQKIRVETELAIRGVGQRLYNHLAETFQPPQGPLGRQGVLISPNGVKVSTRDLDPARGRNFLMEGGPSQASKDSEAHLPPLHISRVIRSSSGSEYTHKLILSDFSQIETAAEGQAFPIAQRGPDPILLKIEKRAPYPISNSFFSSGTPGFRFTLEEGNTRGEGALLLEAKCLSLFSLATAPESSTHPMAPGAGSIVMDWLAAQAALQQKGLRILQIENPQHLNIFMRQGLLDTANTVVEACRWTDKAWGRYTVTETFPLNADALQSSPPPDFFNIRGRPHPRLFEMRSDPQPLHISRAIRSSSGSEYPYRLILPDLSQIETAAEGQAFPIAQRGPDPILAQVRGRMTIPIPHPLFPQGTPILSFVLQEGKARGMVVLVVTPTALSCFALETTRSKVSNKFSHSLSLFGLDFIPSLENQPSMAPGAGFIIMEWLALQAALEGKSFNGLEIQEPRILKTLLRKQLFDPQHTVVESCKGVESMHVPLSDFSLSEALALQRSGQVDFWNVHGRPHPRLFENRSGPQALHIPRAIRSPRGREYPYELILPDFSRIEAATAGEAFPIAQRGPVPILAQFGGHLPVDEPNPFFPVGTKATALVLKEGKTQGAMSLFIEPRALSSLTLDTITPLGTATGLASGAGSIVMDWLATQAALQGKRLNLLHIGIDRHQIFDIAMRQQLFDPANTVVEGCAGFNSSTGETIEIVTIPWADFRLSDAHALQSGGKVDFWNIRGRPNPDLIPRELSPEG
jgi:hypothetical protein